MSMAAKQKPGPGVTAKQVPSEIRAGSYETWRLDQLRQRAKDLGLSGYADLKKPALIALLRRH